MAQTAINSAMPMAIPSSVGNAPIQAPQTQDATDASGSDPSCGGQACQDQFSPDAVAQGTALPPVVTPEMCAANTDSSGVPAECVNWGCPSGPSADAANVNGSPDASALDPAAVQGLAQDAMGTNQGIQEALANGQMPSPELQDALNQNYDAAQGMCQAANVDCGQADPAAMAEAAQPSAPKMDAELLKSMSPEEAKYYATLAKEDPEKAKLYGIQCKLQKLNEMITQLTQLAGIRHDNAKAILQNFRV